MQSRLIEAYLQGVQSLYQATEGMSPEQQVARPIAGKWSTLEVVCHLTDMDAVFADRMKRVIAEDRPTFMNADPDQFASALAYHARNLQEELAVLEYTRRQMVRILGALPESALQRVGVHNQSGPCTLEQLLIKVTSHHEHHLAFIHDKRRALGLPA